MHLRRTCKRLSNFARCQVAIEIKVHIVMANISRKGGMGWDRGRHSISNWGLRRPRKLVLPFGARRMPTDQDEGARWQLDFAYDNRYDG
jgi:hypothetical protein